MARGAPQMVRLVHVLEELARAGRAGRTLAELSRSLAVDKATCRPMLIELTEAGYLVREPRRRTFHLGPRLVAIGRAAEHAVDAIDLARSHLMELTERVGLCTLAVTASADELIVADVIVPAPATTRARRALGLRVGDRLPYRPPFGAALAAWAPPDELRRWRDRGLDGGYGDEPHLDAVLSTVRERGFAVEQHQPDPDELAVLVAKNAASLLGSRRSAVLLGDAIELGADAMVATLGPREKYWPVSINAAVLDGDAIPVMAICVVDMTPSMLGRDVSALGERVADTARAVSDVLVGRRAGRLTAERGRSPSDPGQV